MTGRSVARSKNVFSDRTWRERRDLRDAIAQSRQWVETQDKKLLKQVEDKIHELLALYGAAGIDLAHLADVVFYAIRNQHDFATAQRIFRRAGYIQDRVKANLRNDELLKRHDDMKPRPNIAKLAREVAQENKRLPKEQQRGAGGTNPIALEHHIRELRMKRRTGILKRHRK